MNPVEKSVSEGIQDGLESHTHLVKIIGCHNVKIPIEASCYKILANSSFYETSVMRLTVHEPTCWCVVNRRVVDSLKGISVYVLCLLQRPDVEQVQKFRELVVKICTRKQRNLSLHTISTNLNQHDGPTHCTLDDGLIKRSFGRVFQRSRDLVSNTGSSAGLANDCNPCTVPTELADVVLDPLERESLIVQASFGDSRCCTECIPAEPAKSTELYHTSAYIAIETAGNTDPVIQGHVNETVGTSVFHATGYYACWISVTGLGSYDSTTSVNPNEDWSAF